MEGNSQKGIRPNQRISGATPKKRTILGMLDTKKHNNSKKME